MGVDTRIRGPQQSRWPRFLAYAAALTFTTASCTTNALYGWQKVVDTPCAHRVMATTCSDP